MSFIWKTLSVSAFAAMLWTSPGTAQTPAVNERYLDYKFLTAGEPSGQQNAYYAADGTISLNRRGGAVASAWEGQTALVHFDPPGSTSLIFSYLFFNTRSGPKHSLVRNVLGKPTT